MENVGRRMVEIAEVVVPSVSAKEIYDRRESGEPIVILDIREPDEWAKGYIEGAVPYFVNLKVLARMRGA